MSDLPASVLDLIAAGRKIEAIKEVRALYGLDLRDAKDLVERAERDPDVSVADLAADSDVAPDALAARVLELVNVGRTVQAIKEVREATGSSLKDAKALVDRVVGGGTATHVTPRSSAVLAVVIGMALLALGMALAISLFLANA